MLPPGRGLTGVQDPATQRSRQATSVLRPILLVELPAALIEALLLIAYVNGGSRDTWLLIATAAVLVLGALAFVAWLLRARSQESLPVPPPAPGRAGGRTPLPGAVVMTSAPGLAGRVVRPNAGGGAQASAAPGDRLRLRPAGCLVSVVLYGLALLGFAIFLYSLAEPESYGFGIGALFFSLGCLYLARQWRRG